MAVVFDEDYEGADGVLLSSSNTNFTSFTNTPEFDTAQFAHGSSSGLYTLVTTTGEASLQDLGASVTQRWMRRYIRIDVAPGTNVTLMRVRLAGVTLAEARLNASRLILIRDASTTVATSTTVFPLNTWCRFEWKVDATGTTQELRIFTGAAVESATPTETISGAYAGGAFDRIVDGATGTTVGTMQVWFDAAVDDDAGYPGPQSAPSTWTYGYDIVIGG